MKRIKVLADALPVGPILIGAAMPAHVLTPSVTARGIVNMTAVAVVEAQACRMQGVGPRRPLPAEFGGRVRVGFSLSQEVGPGPPRPALPEDGEGEECGRFSCGCGGGRAHAGLHSAGTA